MSAFAPLREQDDPERVGPGLNKKASRQQKAAISTEICTLPWVPESGNVP